MPVILAMAVGLLAGCTDGGGSTLTKTLAVPVLPDPGTVQRLLGEAYDQPDQWCSELWTSPRPFPYAVACLTGGEFSELSQHEGRTIALVVYPPPELTLVGSEPTAEWLTDSGEVQGDRLSACRDWRPITLVEGEGLTCVDRGWGTVLTDTARFAVASDTVLVIVDVSAELLPPYFEISSPSEVDIDYLEELALDTALRLLAMIG